MATSLNNLALLYYTQGRYSEAEPYYQRALAIWEKELGPKHPHGTTVLKNYIAMLHAAKREAEAAKLEARLRASQPPRGWLGVQMKQPDNMVEIMVERVIPDSPAARAGIQPGDIIMRLDDDEVQSLEVFVHQVASMAPGSTVEIAVLPDGHMHTLQVTVGTRPVTTP